MVEIRELTRIDREDNNILLCEEKFRRNRKNVKQSKIVLACWGPIINKGETNFILKLGWEK